jgi:hypothetical protein
MEDIADVIEWRYADVDLRGRVLSRVFLDPSEALVDIAS